MLRVGYDGFWLLRLLLAAGITNHVFDPASIAVDQRARRAKTDRIDTDQMLRTLMAYCRGEPRVVRTVRAPSPEQEDARRATRERDRLTEEQTAQTNRIKALLRLLGMAVGNPRRRDWLTWLAAQRDWQGQAVPPRLMAELAREHARLMLVRGQIDALARAPARAELTPAAAEMARPDSALTQWFHQRTVNASRRARRSAIVALARKLIVALWRYLTTGLVPAGAVLKPANA